MDLEYVEKLLELLSKSSADEIEIEEEGKKVRVARHRNTAPQEIHVPASTQSQSVKPVVTDMVPGAASTTAHEIRSPIVGTFYRSPAPDAAPFVEVGSTVQPGSV
jgi:acetyl-CoA carboxylase biotin carboxyl carrier protein